MPTTFNIYCDESCHLPTGPDRGMVLGAVWCPDGKEREAAIRMRSIAERHDYSPLGEFKWSGVSPGNVAMYLDVVDYFFDDDDLRFRGLVVRDKTVLDHESFGQTHDDWYYKMYYALLNGIVGSRDHFRVYLDIKDTRSSAKVRKLHEVLCSKHHDFDHRIVSRIQTVRSHEVALVQMADMLAGVLTYAGRPPEQQRSAAKKELVELVRKRSGYRLAKSTPLGERKFNVFFWEPR